MACAGQLTGLTVTDSSFSMDVASTTTLGGSISLSNAGSVALEGAVLAEGAELAVGGETTLSLAQMALTWWQLQVLVVSTTIATPGTVVWFSEVAVTDSVIEALTGSVAVGADRNVVYEPPNFLPADVVRCSPVPLAIRAPIDLEAAAIRVLAL
jgi:hypothetical protein